MSTKAIESADDCENYAATTAVDFFTEWGAPARRIMPTATGDFVYVTPRGNTRTIPVTSGVAEDIKVHSVTNANAVTFKAYR